MAVVTSHTLNGTDGTHAGGIAVTMANCATGEVLFATEMDPGGRLSQEILPERQDEGKNHPALAADHKADEQEQRRHGGQKHGRAHVVHGPNFALFSPGTLSLPRHFR